MIGGSVNGAGIFVDKSDPWNFLVTSTSGEIRFKLCDTPSCNEYNFKSKSVFPSTTDLRYSGGDSVGNL